MLTDPLLKLSFFLHSSPGVYALLLGSGVSRAAGIPTGWEVTIDLIRSVAKLEGEDSEPSPEDWYEKKFGKFPEYAKLLEQVAKTPSERNSLLRRHFEPTDEEREEGLKVPTLAHNAIASLVKSGHIRMILTTNFDRLLEMALESEGITPDVISTDDALKGAIPYVHSKCTIVKLHGDYRDTRIRNTTSELKKYSKKLDAYLDRILDEFGLIICGWSGSWDTALRDAIFRCPSHRFSTFWACIGEPSDDAKRLIHHRKAEIVQIESADKFFTMTAEKIEALREQESPHPLSTAMAVAMVKKYLSDEKYRIRLKDILVDETEKLYKELSSSRFSSTGIEVTNKCFQERMHQYELLSDTLMGMLATLTYYDDKEDYTRQLKQCMDRILKPPREQGITVFLELQYYPAILICYVAGISALATNHFEHLVAVLLRPDYYSRDKKVPAIEVLNVRQFVDEQREKWMPYPDAKTDYTPANNYIFDIVREPLRKYIPDDKKYEIIFDTFEYLLGLIYADLIPCVADRSRVWAPHGCFIWRYRHYPEDSMNTPIDEFINAGLSQGKEWGLLKAGFFGGDIKRFSSVGAKYRDFLRSVLVSYR